MALQNCLKVSYKGLTRNIIYAAHDLYEDIIKRVIETFELDHIPCNVVQLCDERGAKFDKEVFEYFIFIFPNPQKLFFVRLDTAKLMDHPLNYVPNQNSTTRRAFAISKLANTIKDNNVSNNANSEAGSVRRQNCFIGEWPNNNTNNQSLQSARHQNILQGIVKRIHTLKDNHRKTKNISKPRMVKRRMRF